MVSSSHMQYFSDNTYKLLKVGSGFRISMDAVHDKVAEVVGVAAGLDLLHHIDEELIPDLERIKIVALHALLDGRSLDHAQAYHEDLTLAYRLNRVEEL
jgi:hypothetical protein